jgi:hypothetical protein
MAIKGFSSRQDNGEHGSSVNDNGEKGSSSYDHGEHEFPTCTPGERFHQDGVTVSLASFPVMQAEDTTSLPACGEWLANLPRI